jgi:hypothetical protein
MRNGKQIANTLIWSFTTKPLKARYQTALRQPKAYLCSGGIAFIPRSELTVSLWPHGFRHRRQSHCCGCLSDVLLMVLYCRVLYQACPVFGCCQVLKPTMRPPHCVARLWRHIRLLIMLLRKCEASSRGLTKMLPRKLHTNMNLTKHHIYCIQNTYITMK